MYYELNKKDKKIARLLIDKALNAQYKAALQAAQALISSWQEEKPDNKEAYLKLFKILEKHDNNLSERYERLGGSRYLITVINVLFDGLITNDDIKDFSDETKHIITRWTELQNGE